MNYKIRICKIGNEMKEVQVIYYSDRKTIVAKHLGSAKSEEDLRHLKQDAEKWIQDQINSAPLFQEIQDSNLLDNYEYLGFRYFYAYEFLNKVLEKFNLHKHLNPQFKDLVISRILEPNSKRGSLEFLEKFLEIKHNLDYVYERLGIYKKELKESVEKEVMRVAKEDFKFDFSFVLYDVTTLYFESFEDYKFQVPGFSKDHKHNQPQVVIGLVVTPDGFPLSYEVFKGNTFEGKTLLPILEAFKKLHNVQTLTLVADSAMLSKDLFKDLIASGFEYIVGARLNNMKKKTLDDMLINFEHRDGYSKRVDNLIVDYSYKRYMKDSKDLEKQKEKALKFVGEVALKTPKLKYLKTEKTTCSLNQGLIDKHKRVLGLKGYITSLSTDTTNTDIINYYHNLFKVEHAWRIAKSDLEARPIYHFKEEAIKNHILICYVALTLSVYLELKNKMSIAQVIKEITSITSAKMQNIVTKQIIFKRVQSTRIVESIEKVSY